MRQEGVEELSESRLQLPGGFDDDGLGVVVMLRC